jgi:Protein of unknown function (DUF2975)
LNLNRIKTLGKSCYLISSILMFAVPSFYVLLHFFNGHDLLEFRIGSLQQYYSDTQNTLPLFWAGIPKIALLTLNLYWLRRLFHLYSQGAILSKATIECYVWLVWMGVVNFILNLLTSLAGSFWIYLHGGDFALVIPVDFGYLLLIAALVIIIYTLRYGLELEQENQEFI